MDHALDIPEIRVHLGSFLSHGPLARCALVCKSWNDTFTPLLYQACCLNELDVYGDIDFPNVPLETINKHADSVRKLHYYGEAELMDRIFNCTKLTLLLLLLSECPTEIREDQPNTATEESLILNNSATLSTFSLAGDGVGQSSAIWMALSECPKINHIELGYCSLPLRRMREFWEVCSNVEFLDLHDICPPVVNLAPVDTEAPFLEIFPRLRYLTLHNITSLSSKMQLSITLRSPNLVSLKLSVTGDIHPKIQEYREAILAQGWSQLQKIDINGYILEDKDVAMTLDAMTNAKVLVLQGSLFAENAHRSLMTRHSTTIGTLDLRYCRTITSSMVQAILSKCPSLEVLRVYKLCGSDLVRLEPTDQTDQTGMADVDTIVTGEDWVCLKLRVLDLRFEMSGDVDRDLEQEYALRQLSRLSQLECLTIGCVFDDDRIKPTLMLTLDSHGRGLQQLSTLKRLKFLDVGYGGQMLYEQELRWMASNWPKLETMLGGFYPADLRNMQLKDYINNLIRMRKK